MQYEDLQIWKRSRALTIDVFRNSYLIKEYGFKDQITRSALSIPSNIAEGMEKDYLKEKIRFLAISKGSVGEFKTQTDIGIEIGFIESNLGKKWMNEAKELSKMIGKLIQVLRSKGS